MSMVGQMRSLTPCWSRSVQAERCLSLPSLQRRNIPHRIRRFLMLQTRRAGRIPETFRQRPDAVRSLHPTHSVAAIGAEAVELTKDHAYSITPCDELSPYGKLAQDENGYVLLLGVGHKSNTTFHHVEELAGVDYHMQRDVAKATIIASGEEVRWSYLLHQWGTPREFEIMEPLFIERGIQRIAQIGDARVSLVQSRGMVQATLRCLRANARILCKG
jgi:aminoglycoside 3-N-acetyltransferase